MTHAGKFDVLKEAVLCAVRLFILVIIHLTVAGVSLCQKFILNLKGLRNFHVFSFIFASDQTANTHEMQ